MDRLILMRNSSIGLLLMLVSVCVSLAHDASANVDIDRLSFSVVQVRTSDGTGSGTLVLRNNQAAVLTNRHVIEGFSEVVIAALTDLNRPAEPKFKAQLVAYSVQHDFAFLELTHTTNGDPFSLDTLRRGGYGFTPNLLNLDRHVSSPIRRGDTIGILGYPGIGGNDLVYTTGIVSALQQGKIGQSDVPMYYLTNAEISPGNSGGMAFDQYGAFIGIPTSVARETRTGGRLAQVLPLPLILEVMKDPSAMSSQWSNRPQSRLSTGSHPDGRYLRLDRADLDRGFMEPGRSGGPVDGAGLGPDCIGFFPSSPQFELLISERSPEIIMFFLADGDLADTTLLVESPDGRFYCNDDAFDGTLDPGLVIPDARPGHYSVWIGSYHPGEEHNGTLLVGTNTAFTEEEHAPPPSASVASGGELDWRRPPINGSTQLSPGFTPDPHRVRILAGGDLNVSSEGLGSRCIGHANHAPDYAFNWTGTSNPLHIFFNADRPNDNATLVIRDPAGMWLCNDDAGTWTHNPLITMPSATRGTYHIWVGTFGAGDVVRGELRITELAPSVP